MPRHSHCFQALLVSLSLLALSLAPSPAFAQAAAPPESPAAAEGTTQEKPAPQAKPIEPASPAQTVDDAEKAPTEPVQFGADVERIVQQAGKSIVVISVAGRDGGEYGIGSGFVISDDGLIATNMHVIGEARPISVQAADGRKFEVTEVHASDRGMDLAVLRIKGSDLPKLELGDSAKIRQGQTVVALGNPHGLKHSVVRGVISGEREVEDRQMIQLAIPIEPGNSGGPIVDVAGRVLGIVTMKSLVTENLGFAVQINDLKPLLSRPNPVPMKHWMTIGALNEKQWTPLFGARWRQRAGRVLVSGMGTGIGGRSLCLATAPAPQVPFELAVRVKLEDESGAAGLAFHSDGDDLHYGFYPSAGKLRLSRFDGPSVFQWNVLQEVGNDAYQPGEWNHLKVRVEPGRLRCYVNDALVIDQRDARLKEGSVGLCKFRNTKAEFKQFQVGAELDKTQLSEQQAERINQLLGQLPDRAEILAEQLAPLAKQPEQSRQLIDQRIRDLQQQAKDLRRLAEDIHVNAVATQLAAVMRKPEAKIDLAKAALLVSQVDDAELDVAGYLAELERIAEEVRARLPKDADEVARRKELDKYLFADNGYHGSRTDYYHRANSHLNRVIDDREGLPITLSVLYMELARRLDVQVVGVGLPGHFVVRHEPAEGEAQLIDVFERGTEMSRKDAARKVLEMTGRPLTDDHLTASTKGQIVERMLRNLLGIAQEAGNKEAMLRYVECLVAVNDEDIQSRGMRAILRSETGRRSAAVADLDWFLQTEPAGIDLDQIRKMRDYFLER